MAISIDYATKVITVPQADCTFVSGTFYRLPTKTVFKAQVDALLAATDGMPFLHPIDHNTEYTVAGITYAPKVEIVNGYSVEFTPDSAWSVELTESNNNLWDVENSILVQNQVQVIPTNSAGLQVVTSGSGLDAAQDTKLTRIHTMLDVIEDGLDHQEVMKILLAAMAGLAEGADTAQMRFKAQDGTTNRITASHDGKGNRTAVTLNTG